LKYNQERDNLKCRVSTCKWFPCGEFKGIEFAVCCVW